MEGSHGQLGTGLTDGLSSDDTDCLTYLNSLAGSHVCTVTLCTDSHMGTTGQNGTNLYGFNGLTLFIYAHAENLGCTAGGNHMIALHNHIAILIINAFAGISSGDTVL